MSFQTLMNAYPGESAKPTSHLSNTYIVPIDKSFQYEALTHDMPYNSTGYFNIEGAYPQNCTMFGFRECAMNNVVKNYSVPTRQKITVVDSILRKV